MAAIDIDPIVKPVANKLNTRYITIDRFGPDVHTPCARMVFNSGYYVTDASGNAEVNALGFQKFQPEGFTEELTVNLNDPVLGAVMAAAEPVVRQYIADHPEVPMLAIIDDYLSELAINYRTAIRG